MVGKQNRGVRNKIRQVILIDGHPDYLYGNRTYKNYSVKIDDELFSLGKMNPKFIEHLKNKTDFEIIINEVTKTRTRGIEGFKGLKIRKLPDSTTIEVSAKTESELTDKVNRLRLNLLEHGIKSVERCSWVCVIDKAKEKETGEILKEVGLPIESLDEKDNDNDKKEVMSKEMKTKQLRKLAKKLITDKQ